MISKTDTDDWSVGESSLYSKSPRTFSGLDLLLGCSLAGGLVSLARERDGRRADTSYKAKKSTGNRDPAFHSRSGRVYYGGLASPVSTLKYPTTSTRDAMSIPS